MNSGMPPITRLMLKKFDLLTRDAMRYNMPLPEYALKAANIHPTFLVMVSNAAKVLKGKATGMAVAGVVLLALAKCSIQAMDFVEFDASGGVKIEADLNFKAEITTEKLLEKLKESADQSARQIQKDKSSSKSNTATKATTD